MIVLVTASAAATSSRVFVPVAGRGVTVDTLRLDVLDVKPMGASAHYAIVRATDGATARTLVLSETPTRVNVVKDHAIRLQDHPFEISVTPAPPLAIDSVAAERIAIARAKSLTWSATTPSSVLLELGTTWEVSFQLAMDLDGVVEIDAASGRVVRAGERGGF